MAPHRAARGAALVPSAGSGVRSGSGSGAAHRSSASQRAKLSSAESTVPRAIHSTRMVPPFHGMMGSSVPFMMSIGMDRDG